MTPREHAVPSIPADLCLFGECGCTPAGPGAGRRWLLRALGLVAAALAVAGAALPLLPATPFALVAAWAFARSSPRLEAWLTRHPRIGPALEAWRTRRAIPRRAKALAVASLAGSLAVTAALQPGPAVLVPVALLLAGVGAWILSRPS